MFHLTIESFNPFCFNVSIVSNTLICWLHQLCAKSDVICFQETWIEPNQEDLSNFKLDGFNCHFVSLGRGKGVATYYKENFKFQDEVKNPMYQIAKIASKEVDIINVYRSSNAPSMFMDNLKSLITQERETHILGDFNFCYKSDRNNKIANVLDELGFR